MRFGNFNPVEEDISLDGYRFIEEVLELTGGYATGPERDLLSAILFDGIQTYLSYSDTSGAEARARFREACTWIHSSGDSYVFSFESVCEALGVDADYLRIGLANVKNTKVLKGRRRSKRL